MFSRPVPRHLLLTRGVLSAFRDGVHTCIWGQSYLYIGSVRSLSGYANAYRWRRLSRVRRRRANGPPDGSSNGCCMSHFLCNLFVRAKENFLKKKQKIKINHKLQTFQVTLLSSPMVKPTTNKYHEEVLSLQPMIPPKSFDIFHPCAGCSERLDAFRFFFKIYCYVAGSIPSGDKTWKKREKLSSGKH